MTESYYKIILQNDITELYYEFDYGIRSRSCITEILYGNILPNYVMQSDYRLISRNYIMELYYDHNNDQITTQHQKLSIGASQSVRCNASTPRRPSERYLPDSHEDPPEMVPGKLPGHFIMYTLDNVHKLGEWTPPWRKKRARKAPCPGH